RTGFDVTSYTRLAHGHAGADAFRADQPAATAAALAPGATAPGELPGGAATGVFLHDVLEHVDFASARDLDVVAWSARDDVGEVIDAAARRHGVADPAHLAHARDLVWKTLTRE